MPQGNLGGRMDAHFPLGPRLPARLHMFRQSRRLGPSPNEPGSVKFATSTAPHPPLTGLVSNPTPPGQIARERVSVIQQQPGRELRLREGGKFNDHDLSRAGFVV